MNFWTAISDPKHPIWPLARLVVMVVALTVVLSITASQFDQTELITIMTMFLFGASSEGLTQFVQRRLGKPQRE